MNTKYETLMQLIDDWQNIIYIGVRALSIISIEDIQSKQLSISISKIWNNIINE